MNGRERLLGPLTAVHLPLALALDRQALGGLWSESQWRSELEDPRRPGIGLWHDSRLLALACGWLVVDELHITVVAVDTGHRRRGLGRAVLEALLQAGQQQGAARATLEVAATNGPAMALYAGLGFEIAGIRRGYYRNGDDALIQWLKLV